MVIINIPEHSKEILFQFDWLLPIAKKEVALVWPLALWFAKGHSFEDVPAGIRHEFFYIDNKKHQFYPNKLFTDIWGLSGNIINDRSWVDVLHPEDREEVDRTYKLWSLNSSVKYSCSVYRIKTARNRYIWIMSTAAAIKRDKNGNLLSYVGHEIEIDSRIKQEQFYKEQLTAALKQNMRERSLIESAGRISSVVTEKELLKAVNTFIPEIFGMNNFILFSIMDDRIEMLLGKPKNNNRKKYQEAISVFFKGMGNDRKFSVKNNYSIWDVGTTGVEKLIAVFEHNYQLDEKTQFLMNVFLPLILKAWEQISNIKILKKTAATDYLTGALNKMSFEKLADENLVKCRKKKLNACVVMFDIDFFTKVNNTYGHLIGDEVLKFVVQGLSDSLRNNDLLCRWGGEEFALLLTDINKEEAYAVVERIRESANKATLEGPVPVTLSAGLCFMPYNKIESLRSALNKADQSLYDAKNSGRNRLCSFDNLENTA